jgi:hypothetical protein
MDEAGFKGQEADTFQATLVPAATPKNITELLSREIVKALKLPEVKARLEGIPGPHVAAHCAIAIGKNVASAVTLRSLRQGRHAHER